MLNKHTAAGPAAERQCVHCGRFFGTSGKALICLTCRMGKGAGASGDCGLTFREIQIVQLVQEAHTNREISAKLGLTHGTTKQYLCTIFRKLGIRNRTQLALRGRDLLKNGPIRLLDEADRDRSMHA